MLHKNRKINHNRHIAHIEKNTIVEILCEKTMFLMFLCGKNTICVIS